MEYFTKCWYGKKTLYEVSLQVMILSYCWVLFKAADKSDTKVQPPNSTRRKKKKNNLLELGRED